MSRKYLKFPEKISQVSRFPAKSPDSRNKFVFLPKQPLLELSSPVSRIPVTRTLKGNEKQFELAGNSSYRGKFQWNFDQGKGNLYQFKLARNSSYRGSTVFKMNKTTDILNSRYEGGMQLLLTWARWFCVTSDLWDVKCYGLRTINIAVFYLLINKLHKEDLSLLYLSLIHIWRCRRAI